MSKKLLPLLIASLFAAAPAFAQSDDDPMRVQGTVTFGGIYNHTNARDKAKLDEYQDLGNGVLSNVGVRGRNSTTWFEGYGENFGRDDQYMFLRGGMYDMFKSGRVPQRHARTLLDLRVHAVQRQRRRRC